MTAQTWGVARSTLTIRSGSRRFAPLLVLAAFVGAAAQPVASGAKDGGGDVRVAAACSKGVTSDLRLRARDGGIELRFKLRRGRAGSWRVVLVQERRVAWRGTRKTSGSSDSLELRRMLSDLPGADVVTATAWGPGGLTCRASATLPGAPASG